MMFFVYPIIAQYLDPGSGSYLFQIAIAGLTALLFFYSDKIKGPLKKFFKLFKKNDGTK